MRRLVRTLVRQGMDKVRTKQRQSEARARTRHGQGTGKAKAERGQCEARACTGHGQSKGKAEVAGAHTRVPTLVRTLVRALVRALVRTHLVRAGNLVRGPVRRCNQTSETKY